MSALNRVKARAVIEPWLIYEARDHDREQILDALEQCVDSTPSGAELSNEQVLLIRRVASVALAHAPAAMADMTSDLDALVLHLERDDLSHK